MKTYIGLPKITGVTVKARHVYFQERDVPEHWKTRAWAVHASADNLYLGHIQWFARWRCYIFQPEPSTVYEKTCLRDIANFVDRMTIEQRKRKKP